LFHKSEKFIDQLSNYKLSKLTFPLGGYLLFRNKIIHRALCVVGYSLKLIPQRMRNSSFVQRQAHCLPRGVPP